MEEKKCRKCGEVLPITDFTTNKNSKDGYSYLCRRCLKEAKQQGNMTRKANRPADPDRPLGKYSARQLMEELRMRGYDGELTFVQRIKLSKI